jgi:putative membrane protein
MIEKRYHPLLILFDLANIVKNTFFVFIYFFVIKLGSESNFIKYGRLAILLFIGITLVYMILKWRTNKYKLDDTSFHIYKGLFTKTEQTIPFSKIQNVNRHTSFFHRIFSVTSISFETGMTGEDSVVKFEVISRQEADRIEEHMTNAIRDEMTLVDSRNDEKDLSTSNVYESRLDANRVIHFKPNKKDILKASFSSLSFLVLVPLVGSLYFKIDELFHVEEEAEGIFSFIMSSWWIVTIIIMVLVIASATFGIIWTFLKYGKFEISSDHDRIYITKGLINETAFSISKEKVQAIEIHQSIMKRWLGLAEVKLTSAGSISSVEENHEINSLYPFLPINKAYEMISEILPTYAVTQNMSTLPKKSLLVRCWWPSLFWMFSTGVLYYFKPSILGLDEAWLIVSAAIFIFLGVSIFLDFINTRYILNHHFIQFKTGSLSTSLFVSKRDKVIEVSVSRNIFQQLLGLASIKTTNRAKPVKQNRLNDVPVDLANSFYKWYMGRRNEIEFE